MKNAPIVVNPTSSFNKPPKKAPAKPAVRAPQTRKGAALERINTARSEAVEALDIGRDLLYNLDSGTLTTTNALRLLMHINDTIMALNRAALHIKENA